MALSKSVTSGNQPHFEALVTALSTMMPPCKGAERQHGPLLQASPEPEDFIWQNHPFLGGGEDNLRVLQGFESDFACLVAASRDGYRDPSVLCAALDLACAYVKNYALDRAEALYVQIETLCMERGMPWDVKFLQDMATLRCKQSRQRDAVTLLEEVARRTPPHSTTLRNLGTVYNQLGEFQQAKAFFEAAVELNNRQADKEDLWNLGLVQSNLGNHSEASSLLLDALEAWRQDAPEDHVTIAKLHDSVGSCYHLMGNASASVEHFSHARKLFARSVGILSPLYGSACEGLTKALISDGMHCQAFEVLVEALAVHASKDAIHPTPIYELLGIALEDCLHGGDLEAEELGHLEPLIRTALKNLHAAGLDKDANAGILLERMAHVLLRCGMAHGGAEHQSIAARRRVLASQLLDDAEPLVKEATDSGIADLSRVSQQIAMQRQVIQAQDQIYRQST